MGMTRNLSLMSIAGVSNFFQINYGRATSHGITISGQVRNYQISTGF